MDRRKQGQGGRQGPDGKIAGRTDGMAGKRGGWMGRIGGKEEQNICDGHGGREHDRVRPIEVKARQKRWEEGRTKDRSMRVGHRMWQAESERAKKWRTDNRRGGRDRCDNIWKEKRKTRETHGET
jgi:hypothetical protein